MVIATGGIIHERVVYMVINTSRTICHLFVSTGSLSVETPALIGVLGGLS